MTEQIRASVWLDIDELDTPYLFDISIFHLLKSDNLIDHINRAGKVLYRKED
ncbi:hypothetical protein [Gaoshiqia sediminis]|uniref:Uncharacterized protein n=1 Tax=Gaoshiqia sediminis TaxID=2986998 RepID=A0AA42C6W9_9BACT|nr:hypothetical protein [Gaoshiqia sediminis]MCW0484383.1 hypothetical protein [Gaoshiqia sediminis]